MTTPRSAVHASLLVLAGAFVLLLVDPVPAAAQSAYRISQRASVTQNLAGTVVSIDYSRPLARGRTGLIGDLVHWGEVWTPGANEATVLELSKDAKLDGHPVPAGRWSVWIIPSRVGSWELILDPRDSLFHTQRPTPGDSGQIVLAVEAGEVDEHVEALTWSFPRIARDGATLEMAWGTTKVAIELEVDPEMPVTTVTAEEAAPYLGAWEVTFEPNPETGMTLPPTTLTVRHAEDGSLLGRFPPGAFAPPESGGEEAGGEAAATGDTAAMAGDAATGLSPQEREREEARRALAEFEAQEWEFLLVPRAPGIFMFGFVEDGEILDIEEIYHEFEIEDGRAVRFVVRDHEDRIMGRGTRVQ